MFSSRLPLSTLQDLSRSLRHYLGAGLTLVDAFDQQHRRGPMPLRGVAGAIVDELRNGSSLENALKLQAQFFPPMFLSMAIVGERSGMLPEVFGELERYFAQMLKLRRSFIGQIAWPITQFFLAIFILAFLIYFLGQLGSKLPDGRPYDPLGLGLLGASGAATFLGVIFGVLIGGLLLWKLLSRGLANRAHVDRALFKIPALGPCLHALALARFCLALRLTTETGMSIGKALRLSLRATGNSAFEGVIDGVLDDVQRGDDLTFSLTRTRLFPEDLLRSIEVAEESGTLDDVLRHQGDHYQEEASRRLIALTAVAGYLVWGLVALFIIIAIFRLYGSYLNMLNQF